MLGLGLDLSLGVKLNFFQVLNLIVKPKTIKDTTIWLCNPHKQNIFQKTLVHKSV